MDIPDKKFVDENDMTIQMTIEPLVLDVEDGHYRPAIKIITKMGRFEEDDTLIAAGRDYDNHDAALRFANDWGKMRIAQFEKAINIELTQMVNASSRLESNYRFMMELCDIDDNLKARREKMFKGFFDSSPVSSEGIAFDRLHFSYPPLPVFGRFQVYGASLPSDGAGAGGGVSDDDDDAPGKGGESDV